MKRTGFLLKTNAQRYALSGALFGLLFPILATMIYILDSGLPFNASSVIAVQSTEPLLWIIDTAPLFLGVFAALAGRRQDQLENTNQMLKAREQDLEATQLALEERVNERTRELTMQNQFITERAGLLKMVVDISRVLLSTQELDHLLTLTVNVVSQQFDYDHAGIYLIDEQRQHAVLLAASSEGGLRIIQRDRHLRIGEQNLIDFAIRTGQVRAIADTGKDAMFKPEPELPDTCSELILPLKAGQVVIGALDLQSSTPKMFGEEYVSILEILADLVSNAIQNSMLQEKTQRALRGAEASSRQISDRVWRGWMESIRVKGYRYDGIRAEPLKEAKAPSSQQGRLQNIPVRLRGRTIGNLKIRLSETSPEWTTDDQSIAEATAERAALALEGARLLEEAERRAAREAFLSDIAAKLSTSFRLDSILRDTVEELGQTLEGSTVAFQLIDPSAPSESGSRKPDEPSGIWKDSE